MTFNLRDNDKVEYDEYIEKLNRNLKIYLGKNLDRNIEWLNMDSRELTKLPLIWPATVSRALVSVDAMGDTGRHDTHSISHRRRQMF
jgi:hypothetical protein